MSTGSSNAYAALIDIGIPLWSMFSILWHFKVAVLAMRHQLAPAGRQHIFKSPWPRGLQMSDSDRKLQGELDWHILTQMMNHTVWICLAHTHTYNYQQVTPEQMRKQIKLWLFTPLTDTEQAHDLAPRNVKEKKKAFCLVHTQKAEIAALLESAVSEEAFLT